MSKVRERPTLYASMEVHVKTPCSPRMRYAPPVIPHLAADRYKEPKIPVYDPLLPHGYSLRVSAFHPQVPSGEENPDSIDGVHNSIHNDWLLDKGNVDWQSATETALRRYMQRKRRM